MIDPYVVIWQHPLKSVQRPNLSRAFARTTLHGYIVRSDVHPYAEREIRMAEEATGSYEPPTLTVLGTLTELTKGSSLNILGDAVLQASASIITIIP